MRFKRVYSDRQCANTRVVCADSVASCSSSDDADKAADEQVLGLSQDVTRGLLLPWADVTLKLGKAEGYNAFFGQAVHRKAPFAKSGFSEAEVSMVRWSSF